MFVWKAEQRYPIALFEQGEGVNVPALAIERTPWGQHPEDDTVRLASCSSTGKVCDSLLPLLCHQRQGLFDWPAVWRQSFTLLCHQMQGLFDWPAV